MLTLGALSCWEQMAFRDVDGSGSLRPPPRAWVRVSVVSSGEGT